MKINEFAKYKRIAESSDPEFLQDNKEALRVYSWMEQSGRIDEGFWGAIWSWLKRNFSPTARRIYSLSEEYEKEYTAEIRAEYGKLKNSKDLASKFRRSFAGRIADDIEEKMEIEAGDDPDYRELVRALINAKKLKVKKLMLTEFGGHLDPDDAEDLDTTFRSDLKKSDAEIEAITSKLTKDKKPVYKEASEELRSKIRSDRSRYADFGYESSDDIDKLVKLILSYQIALSEEDKGDFRVKAIMKTLSEFVKLMTESARKVKKGSFSKEEVYAAVRKAVEDEMRAEKPSNLEKLGSTVQKKAEDTLDEKKKGKGGENVEKEVEATVTTDHTEDVISHDKVEDSIENAKEETGKENPTAEEIIEEINSEVEDVFQKDNLPRYATSINSRIDKFNALPDDERKKEAASLDYDLSGDFKLKHASDEDVKNMVPAFLDVVGTIVPYYASLKDDKGQIVTIVKRYMFEIYAMKKDHTKKLSSIQKDKLIDNITEKYKP